MALDERFVGQTGAQMFASLMTDHGVKHIFGYPGGAILPVFDGAPRSPNAVSEVRLRLQLFC